MSGAVKAYQKRQAKKIVDDLTQTVPSFLGIRPNPKSKKFNLFIRSGHLDFTSHFRWDELSRVRD